MRTLYIGYTASSFLLWITLLGVGYIDHELLGLAPVILLPIFVATALIIALSGQARRFELVPYFLFSVLIFFCINIICWPLATFSPMEFYSLVTEDLPLEIFARSAALLGVSLSITLLTHALTRDAHHVAEAPAPAYTPQLANLGYRMVLFAFPFVCYRLYQEYSHIAAAGYLAVYAEGLNGADLNTLWVTPFNYIFYTGFGLICAFETVRRRFQIGMTLFLIAALLDGVKGARGAVIVPILFCWWFYSTRFNIKVKLGRLGLYALGAVALFLILTIAREEEATESAAGQFVVDAIASQGRSLQLTSVYLQHEEAVSEYGNLMVFSNLLLPLNVILHPELRDVPQSVEQVMYSNNLKHIFTYILNEDYYLAGGGTGGVYLIELIEAGPVLFILFSALLGWFFGAWPKWMSSPFGRFVSLQVFSTVFYMPRAELFPNLLIFGKSCVVFAIIVAAAVIHRRYVATASIAAALRAQT
jgi:hypothetical protein